MTKTHRLWLLLLAAVLVLWLAPGAQATDTTLPRVVIGPGSLMDANDSAEQVFAPATSSIDRLLEHPQRWAALRAYSTTLLYSDLAFRYAKDADLRRWAARMHDLHLTFEMESGVVKPWSSSGAKSFAQDSAIWNRIIAAGGVIEGIAMDEPMPAAFLQVRPPLMEDRAIHEIATFVALVHQHYPDMKVGLVNAYPTIPVQQSIGIVNKLQADLRAMGVRGLDYYRMDPNWVAFTLRLQPGSWQGMGQIQHYCDSIGLPFSLIYWAANFPRDVAIHGGRRDPNFWSNGIMTEAAGYAGTGIRPDQYVIENWVNATSDALPESDPLTFTGSALDLLHKFYGPPAVH